MMIPPSRMFGYQAVEPKRHPHRTLGFQCVGKLSPEHLSAVELQIARPECEIGWRGAAVELGAQGGKPDLLHRGQ